MLELAHRVAELTRAETARLSILTLDVLTAALADALADALDARATLPPHTRRRALMAQIHAFIGEHLGDADLTPDAIAAAHHISLRYVHSSSTRAGTRSRAGSGNAAWNSAGANWPACTSPRVQSM